MSTLPTTVIHIVIRQMAAPNVLDTDTLLKPQRSGAVYIVVRNISKAKLLLLKISLSKRK